MDTELSYQGDLSLLWNCFVHCGLFNDNMPDLVCAEVFTEPVFKEYS